MAILKMFNDNYIKTMRWTIDGIKCYERHCNCKGCNIFKILPRCKMKYAVLDLLEEFGEPDKKSEIYIKAHDLEIL